MPRPDQGTYIGDLVYGANDGIVTTFAVVTAAAGASLSPGVVIIMGFANLLADGFSMGASNFLARRSEQELLTGLKGDARHAVRHGGATFGAFVLAGLVPLFPYLFGSTQNLQLLLSTLLSGVTFFGIGAARTFLTKGHFWKSGLEMFLVGGFASGVAYLIGWGVKTVFGIVI